jgi:hypothetical protein
MLTGHYESKRENSSSRSQHALWNVVPNGAAAVSLNWNASWSSNSTDLGDVFDPDFWRKFCLIDSDGDGETNGAELGDPCCVWKPGDTPVFTGGIANPFDPRFTSGRPIQECRAGLCSFVGNSTGFLATAAVLVVLGFVAVRASFILDRSMCGMRVVLLVCAVGCIVFGSYCLETFWKCKALIDGGYLPTNLAIEWEWTKRFSQVMVWLTWFGGGLVAILVVWVAPLYLSSQKGNNTTTKQKTGALQSSFVVLACCVPFVMLRYIYLPEQFHGGLASGDTIFASGDTSTWHQNSTNSTTVCAFAATLSSSRIAIVHLVFLGFVMLLVRTGHMPLAVLFWNGHWKSQKTSHKIATVALATIPMAALFLALVSAAGYVWYFRAKCQEYQNGQAMADSFTHFVWGVVLYSSCCIYNLFWSLFFSLVDMLATSNNWKFARTALSQVFYPGKDTKKGGNRAIQLNVRRHLASVLLISFPTFIFVNFDVPRELLLTSRAAAYFSPQDRGIMALVVLGATFFGLQVFTIWLFYTQHSNTERKPFEMVQSENRIHALVFAEGRGANPNRFGNVIEVVTGFLLWMNLTAANFMPTLPYGTQGGVKVGILGKTWVKMGEGFAASLLIMPLDDDAKTSAFYVGFWVFFVIAVAMPFYVLPFFGHYGKITHMHRLKATSYCRLGSVRELLWLLRLAGVFALEEAEAILQKFKQQKDVLSSLKLVGLEDKVKQAIEDMAELDTQLEAKLAEHEHHGIKAAFTDVTTLLDLIDAVVTLVVTVGGAVTTDDPPVVAGPAAAVPQGGKKKKAGGWNKRSWNKRNMGGKPAAPSDTDGGPAISEVTDTNPGAAAARSAAVAACYAAAEAEFIAAAAGECADDAAEAALKAAAEAALKAKLDELLEFRQGLDKMKSSKAPEAYRQWFLLHMLILTIHNCDPNYTNGYSAQISRLRNREEAEDDKEDFHSSIAFIGKESAKVLQVHKKLCGAIDLAVKSGLLGQAAANTRRNSTSDRPARAYPPQDQGSNLPRIITLDIDSQAAVDNSPDEKVEPDGNLLAKLGKCDELVKNWNFVMEKCDQLLQVVEDGRESEPPATVLSLRTKMRAQQQEARHCASSPAAPTGARSQGLAAKFRSHVKRDAQSRKNSTQTVSKQQSQVDGEPSGEAQPHPDVETSSAKLEWQNAMQKQSGKLLKELKIGQKAAAAAADQADNMHKLKFAIRTLQDSTTCEGFTRASIASKLQGDKDSADEDTAEAATRLIKSLESKSKKIKETMVIHFDPSLSSVTASRFR